MIVGIDLGTTFSSIAYVNDLGKPEVLANREGEQITPSVVLFQGDIPLVGSMAKRSAAGAPHDYVSLVKRYMGDPDWQFENSSGETHTPETISALIIKRLVDDAELILGEGTVTDAVITVPAYFNDAQRRATMDAGRIAGLNVRRVLNEPTAAALAYGVDSGQDGTFLVFDLGGGTFDVTVMKVEDGTFEVLATDGDKNLGGFDWDNRLMNLIIERFIADGGTDPQDDDSMMTDLRERAEIAKRSLSSVAKASVMVSHDGVAKSIQITRDEFVDAAAAEVDRCRGLMEDVIDEAGLSWTDVTNLLLVGGSTRMPMIKAMVEEVTGLETTRGIQVDEVVALGAAVQASLLGEQADAGGTVSSDGLLPVTTGDKAIVVQDVTSHGLGTIVLKEGTEDEINSIIIPRNTKIPCQMHRDYQTVAEQQSFLNVEVTQGDDEDPAYVGIVGTERLQLTPRPKGSPIRTVFSYDADQIIHIEIIDRVDGVSRGTFEVDNSANMDREQVEAAAARLRATDVG